jgi:hypothetical protein
VRLKTRWLWFSYGRDVLTLWPTARRLSVVLFPRPDLSVVEGMLVVGWHLDVLFFTDDCMPGQVSWTRVTPLQQALVRMAESMRRLGEAFAKTGATAKGVENAFKGLATATR